MITTSTTGSVSIPPDHFARRVINEYSDRLTSLVREFLQNSVDAGATTIEFTTSDNSLTVRDNGRGIQADRMVEALLTLGGSVKDGQSIGGYGIAKEILLFAHEAYEIRTLNSRVRGRVLAYELEIVEESFPGAEFTIRFSHLFGFDRSRFIDRARDYLNTCQLSAAVFLDEQRITTDLRARKIDVPFAHGRVLSRRLPDGEKSSEIIVRAAGLTMFTTPAKECDKQVVVELEGDVRGMLTSNRDGLRHPYRGELGNVVAKVTIDPRSFDRKKSERVLFPGKEASYYAQLSETLTTALGDALNPEVIRIAAQAFADGKPVEALIDWLDQQAAVATGQRMTPALRDTIKGVAENFSTDFVVSIEGTDLRSPPRAMRPATMSRRHRKLAQLWKFALHTAMKAAGLRLNYRIGFVLDPEKLGCFSPQEDGGVDILINPKAVEDCANEREIFFRVLTLAAHELAHHASSYHSETFVLENDRILLRLLGAVESRAAAVREARTVRL
jgi:hypothetical protein